MERKAQLLLFPEMQKANWIRDVLMEETNSDIVSAVGLVLLDAIERHPDCLADVEINWPELILAAGEASSLPPPPKRPSACARRKCGHGRRESSKDRSRVP